MVLNFPKTRDDWRLDLVGLLAIIGESSVSELVQHLTLSHLVFLPRLFPAPHVLIRTSRTPNLPIRQAAKVLDIYNLNKAAPDQGLSDFAYILHSQARPKLLLEPHSVNVIRIGFADRGQRSYFPFNLLQSSKASYPIGRMNLYSPLNLLTLSSALLALGLLVWACLIEDGAAVVSITLVSIASSINSAAAHWRMRKLPTLRHQAQHKPKALNRLQRKDSDDRHHGIHLPHLPLHRKNDNTHSLAAAIISTGAKAGAQAHALRHTDLESSSPAPTRIEPDGSVLVVLPSSVFILVQTTYTIGFMLYHFSNVCVYWASSRTAKICTFFGAMTLMFGIVVMSNCYWTMQVAIGSSFILLNALYLLTTLCVGPGWHWDLTGFDVETVKSEAVGSFESALWKAVRLSGSTKWLEGVHFKRLDDEKGWRAWCKEAMRHLDDDEWDPEMAKWRLYSARSNMKATQASTASTTGFTAANGSVSPGEGGELKFGMRFMGSAVTQDKTSEDDEDDNTGDVVDKIKRIDEAIQKFLEISTSGEAGGHATDVDMRLRRRGTVLEFGLK